MHILKGLMSFGIILSLPSAASTFASSTDISGQVTQEGVQTTLTGGLQNLNVNPYTLGQGGLGSVLSSSVQAVGVVAQVWQIVQENKPTVAVDTHVATALPVGADNDWRKLTGWQSERVSQFTTTIHSAYGTKAIELTYEVRLLFGGGINGHGRYVASARVVPTTIRVKWGYDLNVKVSVASVYNAGTAADPVGAINLDVQYTYGTVFTNRTQTSTYLLRGDGLIQERTTGQIIFQPYDATAVASTQTAVRYH
jgi:hypothetical protein